LGSFESCEGDFGVSSFDEGRSWDEFDEGVTVWEKKTNEGSDGGARRRRERGKNEPG